MKFFTTRTLSISLITIVLPIAGCQETQNLEGDGKAAAVSGPDAGAATTAPDGGATTAPDGGATTAPDGGSTSTSPGKIVLFGGSDSSGYLDDTWTWDGTSWTENSATGGPDGRGFASGAKVGGSVVMFGGEDATGDVADTWSWNGAAWSKLAVTGPSAAHATVASTLGANLVLFGVSGDDDLPQTWTFNGTAWTQNNPDDAPTVADGWAATNYAGKMLLVASGGFYSWDGTDWTEKAIGSGGPSEEGNAGIATQGGKIVLFGGAGENFNSLDETWTWDGTNWTLQTLTTAPSPRSNPGMATMGDGTVVLFGGCTYGFESVTCTDDSTWTWDGSSWTEHHVPGPSARAPALMVAE